MSVYVAALQLSKLTMTDPKLAEVVEISSDDESVLFICDSSASPSAKIFTPTKRELSPSQSKY